MPYTIEEETQRPISRFGHASATIGTNLGEEVLSEPPGRSSKSPICLLHASNVSQTIIESSRYGSMTAMNTL